MNLNGLVLTKSLWILECGDAQNKLGIRPTSYSIYCRYSKCSFRKLYSESGLSSVDESDLSSGALSWDFSMYTPPLT